MFKKFIDNPCLTAGFLGEDIEENQIKKWKTRFNKTLMYPWNEIVSLFF